MDAAHVVLITRPRRFGKTLLLTTLRAFLELDYAAPGNTDRQRRLFAGLDVLKDPTFCARHMGQYPVIMLSFAEIDGATFEVARQQLLGLIQSTAMQYPFLARSQALSSEQRAQYKSLCSRACDVPLVSSLAVLVRLLHAHCARQVVVLIDEYDVAFQGTCQKGYGEPMLELQHRFLSAVTEDCPSLRMAVLTGCLPTTDPSALTRLLGPMGRLSSKSPTALCESALSDTLLRTSVIKI